MLKPREADIPALFLFFVVLPLVTYILLGKWNEAAKKKERISLLALRAAEEAVRAEAMAAATVIPVVSPSKNGIHVCARCFAPAMTRCSRCKSIRYCSGKCQIIHWRQVHKQECQLLETYPSASPKSALIEESFSDSYVLDDYKGSHSFGYNIKQDMLGKHSDSSNYPSVSIGASGSIACSAKNTSQICVVERKYSDKRLSRKAKKEMSGVQFDSFEEASMTRVTSSTSSNMMLSKDAYINHKLRKNDILGEDISKRHDTCGPIVTSSRISVHERNEHENLWEPRGKSGDSWSSHSACGVGHEMGLNLNPDDGITSDDEKVESKCSPELISMKEYIKGNSESHSTGTKCSKSTNLAFEAVSEHPRSEEERMGEVADASKFARMRDANANPAPGSTEITSLGVMRVMGLKKSPKFFKESASGVGGGEKKKLKMLFPYEEFVKYFQSEVFNLSPRGLLNCGNSCYANAVLQCLMCTKPLSNYLLQRSHSKSCFVKAKDWCLMCDLEQHVSMLRDSGGPLSGAPLSPSNILLHMRSINCQIGDGSQEDAHEFLRFLVTSMQSICLEGLGAESQIDPKLQETTFIQHTFGGRLMSKVKCLRCHHESERYENIMDLSLEILGWVESLEDALTQFTTPEDLDGENMYRCGRCATYVRARKQLSIQDAPNILTIVLKRFQEGRYGKINKCITFPDMLDMVPFMTGTDDVPPLYMLYAVVVHLDTLNASFSGHYVSYVKDFQGNWFRIDDTEVQPVLTSQVMSEGAYILFYMRSCPRPPRALTGKTLQHRAATSSRQCRSKPQKSSRLGQSKPSNYVDGPEPLPNFLPKASATYSEPIIEFSDATSSDWSLFTSSDDASFTTESTRDSLSTVDYSDTCGIDPISSIFNTSYGPEYLRRTFACKTSSKSRLQTRFFLEEKGYVVNLSAQPLDRVDKAEEFKQFGDRLIELAYDGNCIASVKYGNIPNHGHGRTSAHCKV